MGKRLTDTDIWDKAWFRKSSVEVKLFWSYIRATCNAAGIWDVDWEAASFKIGRKVNPEIVKILFKKQIKALDDEHYFIIGFIPFQYGWPLSEKNTMYNTVVKLLKKRGLTLEDVSALYQEVTSANSENESRMDAGPMEDESRMDAGKVKVKVKVKENNNEAVVKFTNTIKKNYPRLLQMSKPITYEGTERLVNRWGKELVKEIFLAMQNHKPLLKKYIDAEQTANSWCRNRSSNGDQRVPEKKDVLTSEAIKKEYRGT